MTRSPQNGPAGRPCRPFSAPPTSTIRVRELRKLRPGRVHLHEARPIRTAIPGTACSQPALGYSWDMFRRGTAWLTLGALAIHAGAALADPPPLCPYVPTLCPPTECGLVDSGVIPRAVNNLGHWAGNTSGCDSTAEIPIMWTPETGAVQFPVPPQTSGARVYALNDRGIAAGVRFSLNPGNYWACVWKDGRVIDLPGDSGGASNALAMNNSDWVVGWRTSAQPGALWMGFVWRDGKLTEIDPRPFGQSQAQCMAVADSGWVAGTIGSAGYPGSIPFRWKEGELEPLQLLAGSIAGVATAVLNDGRVLGYSGYPFEGSVTIFGLPTTWDEQGVPHQLPLPIGFNAGVCRGGAGPDRTLGVVYKISKSGVTQTKHVVWTGGLPHFLSQSIQPVQGASFAGPQAMSSNGFIAGTGGYPGTTGGGWLLTPQAPPADLNGDCVVDGADVALLLSAWGPATGATGADFNLDGTVSGADLGVLLSQWTAE